MKISDIIVEAPPKFYGSQCTKDCSGHKAGYNYARKKPMKGCNSKSPSFTKGCVIGHNHMKREQGK